MIRRSGSTTATPSEIASRISSAWIIIPTQRTAGKLRGIDVDGVEFLVAQSASAFEIVRTVTRSNDSESPSRPDFSCELSRSMTRSRGFRDTPLFPSLINPPKATLGSVGINSNQQ